LFGTEFASYFDGIEGRGGCTAPKQVPGKSRKIMDPIAIAARFTAFTCYLNAGTGQTPSPEEAGRLARENWKGFLPFIDQDLAIFLTSRPKARETRRVTRTSRAMRAPKARVSA